MHATVIEPANACIFTLIVRKRSNWCGALDRLVASQALLG